MLFLSLILSCENQKKTNSDQTFEILNSQQKEQPKSVDTIPPINIIGGIGLKKTDFFSHSVVMIYFVSDNNLPEICTGSFISENVILTAAHCTSKEILDMNILMSANPFSDNFSTRFTIDEINVHPLYKPNALKNRNDLALIRIKEKTLYKDAILNIPSSKLYLRQKPLPRLKDHSFTLTSIGYGITSGKETPQDLIPPEEQNILRTATYSAKIRNTKEIHLLQTNGQGVCFGDSGGPLLIQEPSGREVLIGVASGVYFNKNDKQQSDICLSGAIYMNIAYYLGWIDEFINKKPN